MAKKKEAKQKALEQKEESKAEPVPIDKPLAQMSLAEQLQNNKLKKVTPNASREPSPMGRGNDLPSASVINPNPNLMNFSKDTRNKVDLDQSVLITSRPNPVAEVINNLPNNLQRRKTVMQTMTDQLAEALKKKQNEDSDLSDGGSGSVYSD